MDFIDQLQAMASRIPSQIEHVQTEEATKNAFVMPFINALGYNVFNPLEVVPEYVADVGLKKGEKVDYAIMQDGKPIIIFECKHVGNALTDAHKDQLHRYFSVVDARIGVLTNGTTYRFYSDLEQPNIMDARPFLEINMLDLQEPLVEQLKKMRKDSFDLDEMLSTANYLKYIRAIKGVLAQQLADPNENFVRFCIADVYGGRFTQGVKEQFTPIVRDALRHFINDQLTTRLKSALSHDTEIDVTVVPATEGSSSNEESEQASTPKKDGIVTTIEETEGYYIIKAIAREIVDVSRVVMRDTKSYCGILLDDNNRKPIVRLRFNSSQKYLGLIDTDKNETKVPIDDLNEIFAHADAIKAVIHGYEGPSD